MVFGRKEIKKDNPHPQNPNPKFTEKRGGQRGRKTHRFGLEVTGKVRCHRAASVPLYPTRIGKPRRRKKNTGSGRAQLLRHGRRKLPLRGQRLAAGRCADECNTRPPSPAGRGREDRRVFLLSARWPSVEESKEKKGGGGEPRRAAVVCLVCRRRR
jgi:hypothetical protein